jgi:hypothetical protein
MKGFPQRNGTRPSRVDHRDYDFHRSFGSIAPPLFPENYDTDAGLWVPDQNAPEPTFGNPALPYGCTDYTQADLAADLAGKLFNPGTLEALTHANAQGGYSIRNSLQAARSLGWINAFFNVIAHAPLDYFDTFRLAMFYGAPEKRSLTVGTPWFPSWEHAAVNRIAIVPMPTDEELALVRKYQNAYPWHNHKISGWESRSGVVLKDKSWQGTGIGEEGWLYFPREVINTVMAIPGTVAFTSTQVTPNNIKTIPVSVRQWIMSFVRTFLPFQY